jgi:hypothetical protein
MSIHSPTEAESFYEYLGQSLNAGQRDERPEALLRKWRSEQEFHETCESLREGMADVAAARCQALEQFDCRFREHNGLPPVAEP